MRDEPAAVSRIIETPHGRLEGLRRQGVDCFLGIPFAAPPLGQRRLRSPRPPAAWRGVRPAFEIGPASLQTLAGSQTWLNDPIARQDEDCLYLNVWTPADGKDVPVLVWFHGGATRNGHGGAAACNGENLARRHGILVVTVNYRLGALGGLAHPLLIDEETGFCANWGLQDKIAALAWVQASIESFGGDPRRVTIAGQSSGAANVVLIAQNPDCQGLFAGAIAQSPPLFQSPMYSTLDEAADYTEALAAHIGVTVLGLCEVGPGLAKAEQAFLKSSDVGARFGRPRTAPVLDGQLVKRWPHDGDMAPVPLMIGFTIDEARFWYDLQLPDGTVLSSLTPPGDDAALSSELRRLIRLHYPFADAPEPDAVIAAYRGADPRHADPGSLWLAAYDDLVFRLPILRYAGRHAARGAPAFLYRFGWDLAAPATGAPHATDVPFVFGTIGHPHLSAKIGAGAEATSAAMMAAWAGFVRDGSPGWPALDPSDARPRAMTFGRDRVAALFSDVDRAPPDGIWGAFAAP